MLLQHVTLEVILRRVEHAKHEPFPAKFDRGRVMVDRRRHVHDAPYSFIRVDDRLEVSITRKC